MAESRENVRQLNRLRMDRRAALQGDFARAKVDLHPRNMMARWTERQIGTLKTKGGQARGMVRKNAPVLGAAAGALLLFVTRKPIFDFIRRHRENRAQNKDGAA